MEARDLFSIHRSPKRLNESLQKIFGKKINLEDFSLEQLEDARNKLRTQVSQVRSNSGFNETVENEAYLQATMMLDAIVAEITDREQFIADAGSAEVEEDKGTKVLKKAEEYLAYMSDVFNDREEYDLANELHNLSFELEKVGIGGVMKELKQLTYWGDPLAKGVYKEFSKKFGKFAEGFDGDLEEGMMKDVDYDLHMLAREEDEDQLIDALRGEMGTGVADALNDMMEELKDEMASKGMNDVMRDDDKMIELLMDKLVDEFGEGDFDPADEGGETDDDYALASAGFGSDEDYGDFGREESIQGDDMRKVTEGDYYYDHDDPRSGSTGAIMRSNTPVYDKLVKAVTKENPNIKTASDLIDYYGDEIEDVIAKLYAEGRERKAPKPTRAAMMLEKALKRQTSESIVREGELQQAQSIVSAKTMVDRVGRWIEELSGMENDSLLQLGDQIRDEMGQQQAKAFIEAVAPAIQQALENLKTTRETLSSGVRILTGEEQPAEMLGGEPEVGDDMGATEPDAMNMEPMDLEEPAQDEFAASEPASGGGEAAGREQRESIQYQSKLLRVLAG